MVNREVLPFETEPVSLKNVVSKYLKYWHLFVLSLLLCMGLAYVYLLYATPEYSIVSTIQIKDDKKDPGAAKADAFNDLDIFASTKNIHNEIEVLKAKSLMYRVLSELSMNASYFVEGPIKAKEVYVNYLPIKVAVRQFNPLAYDNQRIAINLEDKNTFTLKDAFGVKAYKIGQEIVKPYATFTVQPNLIAPASDIKYIEVKFNNLTKLANSYNSKLEVAPITKETNVLSITLTDAVPEKGKDIVNKLIEVYNKEAIEDKNSIATNTVQFIDARLRDLTGELSDVEKNVEKYRSQHALTDVQAEARLSLNNASEYTKSLTDWDVQINVLTSLENYLRRSGSRYGLAPSNLNIKDPTLLELVTRFNALQLERQRMLRTTQPDNPLVQNINEQLANLQTTMLENLKNIKGGLVIARNQLRSNLAQNTSRIQQVPSMERDLLEINRQQSIKQALYQYLLQKREESALSLAASVSISRVIDAPAAGDDPVKPKKPLIFFLAFVVGVGLPFAFVFIKDSFNERVQEFKDVELITAAPLLGEISHNDTRETLVVTDKSRSLVAELFRHNRANLQLATLGQDNKVILVTSSMAGEGKTFFSLNLASSLALAGKKVAVLDFDLRKSGLTQNLGIPNEKGISNYLASEVSSIDDILVSLQTVSGLYAIGSGPTPYNPAELILSPKVNEMMEELRERFDHIVLDTSPVGQVADALSLSPYIDSTIYLMRYNYTFKDQVNIIEDIYKNNKLKNLMMVMNDAKKLKGYGSYGYGYTEEKKVSWKMKYKNRANA
ncbi:GumC family protein [Adhaeribacter pallidiroseus]|uniref:non-specific protein-tyrosine kinase n=1 Tax=Adhaeribacter pallidiroseus TaxID=2072847 RepID=A0A369QNT4_9BACT|nr:polysaccharide biosynthesis tyrosine autokinase [Adhaeribacter pallidiroseus]RDC66040.1 Tyrosine-protein kinase ptk [Adhaeribacter pallidiroseus]